MQENGGFGIDILDDTQGYYCGSGRAIGKTDCIYSTKPEAIRAGLQFINSRWSKKDHPEIRRILAELTGQVRQIERPQLSLF